MFVGHYAVSLALKKFEKRASLGVLFLSVQFLDILFFPLVVLGIERFNIVPNFTQSTHFELEYMPYTHSLVASLLWAGLAFALFKWVVVKNNSVALVVALAVFSHWLLDLVVHTPDLPLWSDASLKLGFGLWNNAAATFLLEATLLLAATWLYLRSTSSTSAIGKYGMGIYAAFLILVNIGNIFGPASADSIVVLSIVTVSTYFLFAAGAFWLDRKRS